MRVFGTLVGAVIGVVILLIVNAIAHQAISCCGARAGSLLTAIVYLFIEWPWTLGAMALGGLLGGVFTPPGDPTPPGPRNPWTPQ